MGFEANTTETGNESADVVQGEVVEETPQERVEQTEALPENVIEGEIVNDTPEVKAETVKEETGPEKNIESTTSSDEFPMGYPMRETLKMLGVKPEKEEEVKKEETDYPMDYPFRDTLKSMGIKYEGGVDTADSEKLESGLIAKASEKVEELKDKTKNIFSKAWGKVQKFGSATKELGMSALEKVSDVYTKVESGVVYVKDSIKEKYDGVINWGKEKIDYVRNGIEDAKGVFEVALEEARRRRGERIRQAEQNENMREYIKRKRAYDEARKRLVEIRRKMGMGGRVDNIAA